MKTVEEKAEEYAGREIPIAYTGGTQTISLTELRQAAIIDYLAGYNEAMRWRDPEVELPDDHVDVFVKVYSVIENEFDYYVDCVVSDDTGYRWFKRHGDNVAGWRPIE